MRPFFWLLAILCPCLNNAQPLLVGDRVPPLVMQYIASKTKDPRYAGPNPPFIILDFFATWCGSCIAALPHFDSLQRRMKDSVSVVVVCEQPSSEISQFITANGRAKNIALPFITCDSLLTSRFPHRLLPHEVWIYKGRVMAISLPEEVTPANIRKLIATGSVDLKEKRDILDFDRNVSLYAYRSEAAPVYYSLLTGRLQGAGALRGTATVDNMRRLYFFNTPLPSLFQFASGMPFNRFVYGLGDTAVAEYPVHCYEQLSPVGIDDKTVRQWMLEDLNRQSALSGSKQMRTMSCYVIRCLPGGCKAQTKGGTKKVSTDSLAGTRRFTNVPLTRITEYFSRSIILDETGIAGNLDLTLPFAALKNIDQLNQSLLPYGMTIEKQQRELEVFVITDKKQQSILTPKQDK
jgi:thiol-disulfide isomerase/thioredoxin